MSELREQIRALIDDYDSGETTMLAADLVEAVLALRTLKAERNEARGALEGVSQAYRESVSRELRERTRAEAAEARAAAQAKRIEELEALIAEKQPG